MRSNLEAKDAKRQFQLGSVTEATSIVRKLLDAKVEGNQSREEHLWHKFLNEDDKRVSFEAFRLMLSYAYGKPTEKAEIEHKGGVVAEVPIKMSQDEWQQRFAPPKVKKADA